MAQDWLDQEFSLKGKRVWVVGHGGMVGSSLIKRLKKESCDVVTAFRAHLDLRRQQDVERWMESRKPDVVILAAAKVGGIMANAMYPADFLYDNLMIETNVIHAAYKAGVEKLLFLGSSCIYPKFAAQPIEESALLTGALEPTNEAYAVAKIAGLKLCETYRRQYKCDFISAMPCNLYGPGDNFDPETSHVIPALMRKSLAAKAAGEKNISVWGTGTPRREFLYVDDLADALVFLLKNYSGDTFVNVGAGSDITIAELAMKVSAAADFTGDIVFDSSKPDGTPRKLMDSSRIMKAGWKPQVSFEQGLRETYAWLQGQSPARLAA